MVLPLPFPPRGASLLAVPPALKRSGPFLQWTLRPASAFFALATADTSNARRRPRTREEAARGREDEVDATREVRENMWKASTREACAIVSSRAARRPMDDVYTWHEKTSL